MHGTYAACYPQAREVLILKADGKFRQTVVLASSAKTNEAMGTWRYDCTNRHIVFDGYYMAVLDGFGRLGSNWDRPSDGIFIFPVRAKFGRITIDANDEVVYRKLRK